MKKLTQFYSLLLLVLTASQTDAAELKQLPAHVGGRVIVEKTDQNTKTYQYSWPSVYFETAFKGDSLTLKFDDEQNIFQLIVDNNPPVTINKPGKTDYPVANLAPGTHTIRLEKITETQTSNGRFLGFYTNKKSKSAPLPKRKRQIEFIGDSFTVGYGNTSAKRECTEQEVYETTNSQLSFAPLTAKTFNADYQVNAFSGLGVVRNYNGITPEKSLPKIYPYTLSAPTATVPYQGKWRPQVIVIGLGSNDFSTGLKAGERWSSREQLHSDYVDSYVEFVKGLHKKHRKAQFILLSSDKFGGEIAAQVNRVVTELKNAGVKKIDSIVFSDLDYKGCHWHPSVKDNQMVAEQLIDNIKSHLKWQP